MDNFRRIFSAITKDDIPSTAVAVTNLGLSGNVLYIPLNGYDSNYIVYSHPYIIYSAYGTYLHSINDVYRVSTSYTSQYSGTTNDYIYMHYTEKVDNYGTVKYFPPKITIGNKHIYLGIANVAADLLDYFSFPQADTILYTKVKFTNAVTIGSMSPNVLSINQMYANCPVYIDTESV